MILAVSAILPAFHHLSATHSNAFHHLAIQTSAQTLLVHIAVLENLLNLAHVSANHAILAHFHAIPAPPDTIVNISLANQTGSSVIVLLNCSIQPYLSHNTLCPSFVQTSVYNQTIVSTGLSIAEPMAEMVFKKDGIAFTTIVGTAPIPSPNHHNFSLANLSQSSVVIVGILFTTSFTVEAISHTGFNRSKAPISAACCHNSIICHLIPQTVPGLEPNQMLKSTMLEYSGYFSNIFCHNSSSLIFLYCGYLFFINCQNSDKLIFTGSSCFCSGCCSGSDTSKSQNPLLLSISGMVSFLFKSSICLSR
jgi:hypothetical protein